MELTKHNLRIKRTKPSCHSTSVKRLTTAVIVPTRKGLSKYISSIGEQPKYFLEHTAEKRDVFVAETLKPFEVPSTAGSLENNKVEVDTPPALEKLSSLKEGSKRGTKIFMTLL